MTVKEGTLEERLEKLEKAFEKFAEQVFNNGFEVKFSGELMGFLERMSEEVDRIKERISKLEQQ